MRTKIKYTLLKRNKKYNYKVYEKVIYNDIIGCEYSYLIEEYDTGYVVMSGLTDWCQVEETLKKLKESE